MALVKKIVPYDMKHNSETDCTDLLMEIEHLEMLIEAVDQKCYKKVCLYLRSCVPYAPDPENTILMKTAMAIYRKFDKHCEAMVVALQRRRHVLAAVTVPPPPTRRRQVVAVAPRLPRARAPPPPPARHVLAKAQPVPPLARRHEPWFRARVPAPRRRQAMPAAASRRAQVP